MRLRRGFAAAVALAVLAVAGGCGNPAGVDGSLINNWQALGAPTSLEPTAGSCHLANFAEIGARSAYEEIDCKLRHRAETVYVGTFGSPAAEAAAPPADGSAGSRAAYRTCDLRTTQYVGGPWRTARLWVGVTRPSAAAWTGGARWFRCELLEISSIEDDGGLIQRLGSLRDSLTDPSSDLMLACYAIKLDKRGAIDTMPAASCAAPHNAEFVGIWYAAGLAYPKTDTLWAKFHNGCREIISAYVGVPDDDNQEYRTGVVSLPGGEDVWALGDNGVRCYLWVDGTTLNSTVQGKGDSGLPILYK